MASAKGYTMVHIKVDTHTKLKDYCNQNGMKMGIVIQNALEDYLLNQGVKYNNHYEEAKAQALQKTQLFEEMKAYINQIVNDKETN